MITLMESTVIIIMNGMAITSTIFRPQALRLI